jgi:hypothetical protein
VTNSTPPDGPAVEPALIYDAGERRTSAEHAAEALDFARRANAMYDWRDGRYERAMDAAKWHATMAVYEALREARA